MQKNTETESLRTWVEIDTKAITHNYRAFRRLLSLKTKLMIIVKSNAYGHGIVPFAKQVEKLGVDFLGVDSIEEALELRKNKIKSPILVFGYIPQSLLPQAAAQNISVTVSNFESLHEIAGLKKKIKVHIKADTGLGRQGFLESDLPKVIKQLQRSKNILVEGLYTHFAGAESPRLIAHSKKQIESLNIWKNSFSQAGFKPLIHAGATAATFFFPDFHFDMVRIGIGMYGLYASSEMNHQARKKLNLRPVLEWKTVISEVKELPIGSGIGYDLTEMLSRDSTVAICPIGYWHGYPRSLSRKGVVYVHNRPAKILGRISMDMIAIDVTNIPKVKRNDTVTLVGKAPSASQIAEIGKTINYEIVTRINPDIRRIYK